jgi:hypothetical protein
MTPTFLPVRTAPPRPLEAPAGSVAALLHRPPPRNCTFPWRTSVTEHGVEQRSLLSRDEVSDPGKLGPRSNRRVGGGVSGAGSLGVVEQAGWLTCSKVPMLDLLV